MVLTFHMIAYNWQIVISAIHGTGLLRPFSNSQLGRRSETEWRSSRILGIDEQNYAITINAAIKKVPLMTLLNSSVYSDTYTNHSVKLFQVRYIKHVENKSMK